MIPLVIDVTRKDREREFVRLIKMVGSEDVGMYTKHGLVQLDYKNLLHAVVSMEREERKAKWNWTNLLRKRKKKVRV